MERSLKAAVGIPSSGQPVWVYSRSSEPHPRVLFEQTKELLWEAQNRGYSVAGVSQDMGSGRSMARMGLMQMMQAVRGGFVRTVLVRDVTCLSCDPAILLKLLEFLRDCDAGLITIRSGRPWG